MSANSGEEIYNRVVVEGTAADGEKLTIERSASQAAGVVGEPITSPAPDNPSFATDTASWTAGTGTTITRDTFVFNTSPASGRWESSSGPLAIGATLTETFTGTFRAGVSYALTVALRAPGAPVDLDVTFGVATDSSGARVAVPDVAFGSSTVVWTPSSDRTSVVLTLRAAGVGVWVHVDSLVLTAAKPTLVDRRGFRRTHILPVKSSLTAELGTQIADVWLAAHKTTPFKGTARIEGDRAAREITTGASIPPEQFLLHTGELLRLADRIDPDTGGQGRDGRIAEVTYTPADDTAVIALDSRRTSHEALLERLAIVVGGG